MSMVFQAIAGDRLAELSATTSPDINLERRVHRNHEAFDVAAAMFEDVGESRVPRGQGAIDLSGSTFMTDLPKFGSYRSYGFLGPHYGATGEPSIRFDIFAGQDDASSESANPTGFVQLDPLEGGTYRLTVATATDAVAAQLPNAREAQEYLKNALKAALVQLL